MPKFLIGKADQMRTVSPRSNASRTLGIGLGEQNGFYKSRDAQIATTASNDPTSATDSPEKGTVLSELLTEKQVGERWNVSLNTLRFWRSTGDGPRYVKLGRSVRYNVSALEKYLRRNTCESKTRATAEEALQHVAH